MVGVMFSTVTEMNRTLSWEESELEELDKEDDDENRGILIKYGILI